MSARGRWLTADKALRRLEELQDVGSDESDAGEESDFDIASEEESEASLDPQESTDNSESESGDSDFEQPSSKRHRAVVTGPVRLVSTGPLFRQ